MIRIGDYIKMNSNLNGQVGWYSARSFKVLDIQENVLFLENNEINGLDKLHRTFAVLDVKEMRRQKLKKIFEC